MSGGAEAPPPDGASPAAAGVIDLQTNEETILTRKLHSETRRFDSGYLLIFSSSATNFRFSDDSYLPRECIRNKRNQSGGICIIVI